MYTKNFVNPCPDWATALLNGFSQVLLLRNPLCGLCCLLAILVTAPSLVGGALLGGLLYALGPAVVFGLAAACFARSSPRFYQWLVEHPRLGPWIRDYLDGNGIPLKGKVYAIGLMWLSIGISCYLVPLPWARGFMLTSAVLVTVYILRQKTLPPR